MPKTFLVLEDHPTWRQRIVEHLDGLGLCALAYDGPVWGLPTLEAWRLDETRLDAVGAIVDLNLDGLSGLEVAEAWRTAGFNPSPLLFISADARISPAETDRRTNLGAELLLKRPDLTPWDPFLLAP